MGIPCVKWTRHSDIIEDLMSRTHLIDPRMRMLWWNRHNDILRMWRFYYETLIQKYRTDSCWCIGASTPIKIRKVCQTFLNPHWLINFIETKAKYRHLQKIDLKRDFAAEFIDWRYSKSCWYFRPSFVNCCIVATQTFSLVLLSSTLPPSLCE